MIAVGGFKVFPSEVEKVLLEHEAVKEALVLGLPDTYRGESVNGYITLAPDAAADAEAIKAWVNARLGKHERLETLGIRDSLPKTMIGKLDRKALKAEISGES